MESALLKWLRRNRDDDGSGDSPHVGDPTGRGGGFEIQSADKYADHGTTFAVAQCDACGGNQQNCSCHGTDGGEGLDIDDHPQEELLAAAYLADDVGLLDSREDKAAVQTVMSMTREQKDMLVAARGEDSPVKNWDDLVAVARDTLAGGDHQHQHQSNQQDDSDLRYIYDGGFASNADLSDEDREALHEAISNATGLSVDYLAENYTDEELVELADEAGVMRDDLTGQAAAAQIRQELAEATPLREEFLQQYNVPELQAIAREVLNPENPPAQVGVAAAMNSGDAGRGIALRQQAAEAAKNAGNGYVPRGYFAAKNAAEEAEESEEGGVAEDSESDDMGVFDRLLGGDSGPGQNRQQGHPAAGQHGQPDGDGGEEVAAGSRKHGVNYTGRTRGQPSGGDDEDDGYVARGVFNELNRREAEGEEADD